MVFNAFVSSCMNTISPFWAGFWGLVMVALVIFIVFFVVLTLIHQASTKRWIWFVLTFVLLFFGLGLLIALIYWMIWFFSPKFRSRGN